MKTQKLTLIVILSMMIMSNAFSSMYAEIYPEKRVQKQHNNYNSKYQKDSHMSLDDTIIDLADRLLISSKVHNNKMSDLAITSFVDLHQLNKTTHFGRTLGESMFDELFVRGFRVNDFRGQNSLSVNAGGEYFITRDVNLLKNNVSNGYVLVGTYSMFENKMLINARIIDNQSGQVVASARSYYKSDDCRLLENCREPRKIRIVTDGCSSVGCPSKSCPSGICGSKYNVQSGTNYNRSIKISSVKSSVNHNKQQVANRSVRQNKNITVSLIQ